ncbi:MULTISPECIES: hypothetical protein [unclassified Sinorhizobium]|nr:MULTISPECIES: hypothetical protein [unclassified Sinorhizobium]MDK1373341.1 hypothetical protein [Sinorhizobium sp. 6-70]MDK1482218.1 hypothetical protein [Sinorhizobium sp. 6-117]
MEDDLFAELLRRMHKKQERLQTDLLVVKILFGLVLGASVAQVVIEW